MKTSRDILGSGMCFGFPALILGLMVLGPSVASSGGAEWFVATDGGAPNDGGSWATAFTHVQQAIDAAAPGDAIYLKGETFTLVGPNPPTGKLYWGSDKHDLTLAGGYQGIGAGAGPLTNTPTVLQNTAAASDTTNRLLYVAHVTNGILRNLTLQGGQIGWNNPQTVIPCHLQGAGVYMTGCTNMLFDGVTLKENAVRGQQQSQIFGGGMYALNSYGTITNSVVMGNWLQRHFGNSSFGGGLHLAGGAWLVRDTVIRDNTTANQTTYGDTCRGIGIYINGGTHTIRNCLITRNYGQSVSTPQGEAIYVAAGTADIENCTLYWHRYTGIQQAGTAVVILRNSIVWDSGADLAGTITIENSAVQSRGDADPQFERGLFLAPTSPYHDAGGQTVAEAGLIDYTVRADGMADSGDVALGYHFPPGSAAIDYYVDALKGTDASDGLTAATPFKTMTRALSFVGDGSHVLVAAGTYDLSNGETFPLSVAHRYGVQILGAGREATLITPAGTQQRAVSFAFVYPDARFSGFSVTNAYFYAGYAYGAGIYVAHSQIEIEACEISFNRAHTDASAGAGWGSTRAGGLYGTLSQGVIDRCIVRGNRISTGYSHSYSLAGGIYLDGTWMIRESDISGNEAYTQPGYGAWTAPGGGLYLNGTITVRNCLIANNRSRRSDNNSIYEIGDGVYGAGGMIAFESCTIATNRGEGIRQAAGTVTAVNSILWDNGVDVTGTVSVAWSTVGQAAPTAILSDCIAIDPLFVNAPAGDYRLQSRHGRWLAAGGWAHDPATSPCLDAGTNAPWMNTAVDLDGFARLASGTFITHRAIVDMGAYETQRRPRGSLLLLK